MKRAAWFRAYPVFIIAFLASTSPRSMPRSSTARSSSTSRDQSGGAVPGAEVTVTNTETGMDAKRDVE